MSTITVAIVITEGFSTFHVSVPLILFGEILEGKALFSRRVCAEEPGLIWSAEGTAMRAEYGVVCGRGRNPTLRLWPAIFSGEIDVFPSERRNMGQEIGR